MVADNALVVVEYRSVKKSMSIGYRGAGAAIASFAKSNFCPLG